MKADRDALVDRYRKLEDDDLLQLHASGSLTDIAYETIEAEMASRNMSFGSRPIALEDRTPPSGFLRAHWYGDGQLWSAFWLVGVLGTALASAVAILIGSVAYKLPSTIVASQKAATWHIGISLVIFLAYLVFATICIWRCARGQGVLGIAARSIAVLVILVTVGVFVIPLVVYG